MELQNIRINEQGELTFKDNNERKLFSWNIFDNPFPTIILTKEEAIKRSLDINKKYFIKVEGRRVLIKIK